MLIITAEAQAKNHFLKWAKRQRKICSLTEILKFLTIAINKSTKLIKTSLGRKQNKIALSNLILLLQSPKVIRYRWRKNRKRNKTNN